jgi:hypothetical protein
MKQLILVIKPVPAGVGGDDTEDSDGRTTMSRRVDVGHRNEAALQGKTSAVCFQVIGRKLRELEIKMEANMVEY